MDRQARINLFSLAAHRLAVARLREQPERVDEALGVLRRWREQAVGLSTDRAATLHSVSPLGRFISAAERNELLRQFREVA